MPDSRALFDVIVIGAGPAGSAVAARLLQKGLRNFVVLDRYQFPRDKPCGGGLTGHAVEAFAQLDFELRVPFIASDCAIVRFGSVSRHVAMQRPVNVVRRVDFDADLVAQVRDRGAEILEGEGAEGISVHSDSVAVTTTTGRVLRARIVVGADGVASVVRRHLRGNRRELPHRLYMQELAQPTPISVGQSMVYDFTAMQEAVRGYFWLFPVAGQRCNVGIMHYPADRRAGTWLTQRLRDGLSQWGVALPEKGARGWPVYGYEPRGPICAPRLLTVGDAAGIDALTGEGIAVAMEQAILAADAIERALASDDLRFLRFTQQMRREVVGRELTLDRRLARLLYQPGERWREWMSLVLFDPDMLTMYAARVSGSEVLADQKWRLLCAMGRHLAARRSRRRALDDAGYRQGGAPAG